MLTRIGKAPWITVLLLAVLVTGALGGCGASSKSPAGTAQTSESPSYGLRVVRWLVPQEPETLDPAAVQDQVGSQIAGLLFDTLVGYDAANQKVVPRLADRWTASPDGQVYTFHLRPGVRFHNGRQLKAEDVKYSLERSGRLLAGGTATAGAKSRAKGAKGTKGAVAGIVANGDYDLTVTLSQPDPNFLVKLADPSLAIVARESVEAAQAGGARFGSPGSYFTPAAIPIGTGPFRLAEWIRGEEINLGANPDYFGGAPGIDRLEIKVGLSSEDAWICWRAGQIDVVQDAPVKFRSQAASAGRAVQFFPTRAVSQLFIAKHKPLDDLVVRLALINSIDRQALAAKTQGAAEPEAHLVPWARLGLPVPPGGASQPGPGGGSGQQPGANAGQQPSPSAGQQSSPSSSQQPNSGQQPGSAPAPGGTGPTPGPGGPANLKDLLVAKGYTNPSLTLAWQEGRDEDLASELARQWQAQGVKTKLVPVSLSQWNQALLSQKYDLYLIPSAPVDPRPEAYLAGAANFIPASAGSLDPVAQEQWLGQQGLGTGLVVWKSSIVVRKNISGLEVDSAGRLHWEKVRLPAP